MLNFYSVLEIKCDSEKENEDCWDEMSLQIEENESKRKGLRFFKDLGWEIKDSEDEIPMCGERCICPFCKSGILKEDMETIMEEKKD